jgi:diguanylate cyclase (GGDEF)-like protein/PAS domain S-box-containing protein/putative nucleotidyltransferase with HDIG domain
MKDRKTKILAIDDNWDNLVILKALINDTFPDVEVITTHNGLQGIALAIEQEPDVILLDIVMPGMDGFETCQKLKAEKVTNEIPVVFVTAVKEDKGNRIRALECGAEAFLAKPIDESELTVQIRVMLKIRAANIEKQDEKRRLAALVSEKTKELEKSQKKTLHLLEAIKEENIKRKKSEEALLEAQELAHISSYEHTIKTGRIVWTKEVRNIFCIKEASLIDTREKLQQFIHPDDAESFIQKNKQAIATKSKFDTFFRIIRSDGEERFVELRFIPFFDENDVLIFTKGTIQDITDRRKAEQEIEEKTLLFYSLFDHMSSGSAIYRVMNDGTSGKDFIIQYFNQTALRMEKKTKEQVVGKSLYELRPNIDDYGLISVFRQVWKTGESVFFPSKVYIDDEYHNWYENRIFRLPSGEIVAIFDDVTESMQMKEAIKESEKKYSSYIENAPDGIFVVDEKGRYVEVNRAATLITGYTKEQLLEKTIEDITADDFIETAMNLFVKLTETGSMYGVLQYKHKSGENRWWTIDAVKLTDHRFLGFSKDVTEMKKTEDDRIYLIYHDPLTNLNNRRFFEDAIKKLDKKENLPVSIIMGDVNGLKLINDSFGHDTGDDFLKKTADTIKKACRPCDVIARLGGDEFAVILPKTDSTEAQQILANIKNIAADAKIANIELSISLGCDTKEQEGQSMVETMANAENDMYRHKIYERSSMRSKIVDIIMNTLFEKSNREMMHSRRVSEICEAIAIKMNFNKDEVGQIRTAGLVHDIGKIGIDEKILNKNGRPDEEEWKEIKKHPEMGWRILSSTKEFSEMANLIVSHHEKWDGSGYPNGLKGEEIPLDTRIITIADAYDAMTSERSYRKSLTEREAIGELKRCSGTQFDPLIVNVFLSILVHSN